MKLNQEVDGQVVLRGLALAEGIAIAAVDSTEGTSSAAAAASLNSS
jgi:hypothetical protein